jgi:hypothetical protein
MGWIAAQNPAKILAPNYFKNNLMPLPQMPVGSTGYHGERPTGAQNIQMDATGQKILFFIIDEHVYSRKGELIGDLPWVDYTAETAPIGMTGEVAIIPSKQCFNEFIILSTYKNLGVTGSSAMYDKIKVEYDANGNLINNSGLYSASLNSIYDQLKIENLIGNDYYATNNVHDERATFAISKMNTNGIRYVFIHNGTKVFRMKIQNGNLQYDNYYIDLILISQASLIDGVPASIIQEMELITLSNGNLRIAVPIDDYVNFNQANYINGNNEGYFVFDYSATTLNVVPNSLKKILYPTNFLYIKGAEFSPDGNKLYLSHQKVINNGITSTIDMFDLTAANPYLTKTVISNSDDYANSQLEIDNQGGLLIPASNRLSRLANCNNPILPLNFTNVYLPLNNYTPISFNTTLTNVGEKVTPLQDQIDDETYSNFGSVVFSIDNFTVSATNTVWEPGNASNLTQNDVLYIKDYLIIPAGKTLTIKNMKIYFSEHARVIIENSNSSAMGGYLQLNNTILSADNQCDIIKMWRGVEVRGNSYLNQGSYLNSKQGRLNMYNNSKIEHAFVGVTANKYNKITLPNGLFAYQVAPYTTGGIVRVTNSIFKNNQRDIEFNPYSAPNNSNNVSLLSNTRFETNGLLNYPSLELRNHVELVGVKGINITGCDFINVTPQLYALNKQGVGINANYSSFFVLKRCSIPGVNCVANDPNKFDDLYIGIYAKGGISSLNASFYTDGSLFTNNHLGVYTLNTYNHKVLNNTFVVSKITPSNPSGITQTAGLYMKGSTGYAVEGNLFKTNTAQPLSLAQTATFGIVVNNSGESSNLIYRNIFENLKIGGQSELINGSLSTSTNSNTLGLQWKCNTFRNTLEHDLSIVNGRIDHHQGTNYSPSSPAATLLSKQKDAANNVFSFNNEGAINEHDIVMSNSNHNLLYVFNQNPSHTPDSYTLDGTINGVLPIVQTFNGQPVQISSTANSCPVINRITTGISNTNFVNGLNQLHVLKTTIDNSNSSNPNLVSKYYHLKRSLDLERDQLLQELVLDTTSSSFQNINQFFNATLNEDKDLQEIAVDYYLSIKQYSKVDSIINLGLVDNDFTGMVLLLKTIDTENVCESLLKDSVNNFKLISISENTTNQFVKNRINSLLSSCNDDYLYSFLPINKSRSFSINESNNNNADKFKIYPNPTNGDIQISSNFENEFTFTIISIEGKVVLDSSNRNDDSVVETSTFDPGLYIINFYDTNQQILESQKFIKH